MEASIKKYPDFRNELGVAFEKHSGILLSKILKRENSTYFNLKFTVTKAILSIKQDLITELFKDEKKEYDSYVIIKDLVSICDKYLEKVKNFTIMSFSSDIKSSETDSSVFEKKYRISPKNIIQQSKKNVKKKKILYLLIKTVV